MKKIKLIFIGAVLPPNVDLTVKAGLAVVFDGLSEIPAEQVQEVINDLKLSLDNYNPSNKADFQQWFTDVNVLVQQVARDTNNATAEKDATWFGQIATSIASGGSLVSAIFTSLFKKHTTT